MSALNLRDFEALARQNMDPAAFDYYAGGANDERTLSENQRAFSRLGLRPRVLVDVDQIDTRAEVLGAPLPFGVALAPTAFNRLGHPDGELAAARAAGAAGTLMCCSTIASTTLEDIAAAATAPLWFQLYVYRDREVTRDLIARAEAAGYQALVLTVDTPRLGRRERDDRNTFTLPSDVAIKNLEKYHSAADSTRWADSSSFKQYVHDLLDASLTWDSVDWLCATSSLPVVIKGVIAPEDAELAIQHGAKGVVVSNHGGRQLDGVLPTIEALPAVAERVDGRVPVLMDGGIRRGTDVVTALALGAAGVLIGRPYLWALAADGEAGVRQMLELLRSEVELAMALCGCRSVAEIGPALVVRRP
jgi:4-hydroxymandelate oxidase